jgi:hypothetical protein
MWTQRRNQKLHITLTIKGKIVTLVFSDLEDASLPTYVYLYALNNAGRLLGSVEEKLREPMHRQTTDQV